MENTADLEELQEFKERTENNFKALHKQLKEVQKEMRNNKPQENIKVRKVQTDDGPRIIVEHAVQRWYSPEYFKKMLSEDDKETIFGDEY